MAVLNKLLLAFVLLVATPLALHGAVYWSEPQAHNWSAADWSSAGLLPPAREHREAVVRIYSARTGAWKGMFATHTWIVLKETGAPDYERWDKVGWGSPIRRNHRAPDGRWYGHDPDVVYAADGAAAERLIPRLRAGIAAYRFRAAGDYRVWPGPNSNTFVAAVLAAVPEIGTASSIAVMRRASPCLRTGSQVRSCSTHTLPSRSIDCTVYGSQCRPSFAIVW